MDSDKKVNLTQNFKDKIEPTAFLIWLIKNYPKSKYILKENINYQNNFK